MISISIFLIFVSLLFKNSKFLTIFILVYCWVLFGFNTMNGDYDLYERMYNGAKSAKSIFSYEAGYNLLMYLGNLFGFTFQIFFKVIAAFILTVLGVFSFKFSRYSALFVSVFLVVYLPIEYVLLRNFLSFSIVLIGIMAFLKNQERGKFLLLVSILIATTVHISSIFYFLIYFAFLYKNIKPEKVFLLTLIGLFAFTIGGSLLIGILKDTGGRGTMYLTRFPQFLLYTFFQIGNYFLIHWYFKSNISINPDLKKIIIAINLYLVFLVILYFNYAIFIRIFLNISLVNVLFMLNHVNFKFKRGGERLIVLVLYLAFFFFEFVFPVMKDSLDAMYENNNFFYE